jgi:DNA excision repair protein ERCC-3
VLKATDRAVLVEVAKSKKIVDMLGARIDADTIAVHPSERGRLKQALLKLGWPAEDLAGYVDGEAHPISLRENGWHLRPYQRHAVEHFWAGGSGVVVLPCGAGKTLVGAAAMAQASATTLILVTNTVAGRQWKRELIARTSLTDAEIGEYSGERKEIRPVTIATYQILTTRRGGAFTHLDLFGARDWGLGHLRRGAPAAAPIFRFTADLQARRRLGLTATLGPRRRPRGRRLLADRAEAIRRAVEGHRVAGLDRSGGLRRGTGDPYRDGTDGVRDRGGRGALPVAATARTKLPVVRSWSSGTRATRSGDRRLPRPAARRSASTSTRRSSRAQPPTGSASALRRVPRGELQTLVISKVGNFSIDLPEAAVAIQVSGTFGSGRRRRSGSAGCSAEGGRPAGALLHGGLARHDRHRVRRRTGSASWPSRVRVHDRRCRRRARPASAHGGLAETLAGQLLPQKRDLATLIGSAEGSAVLVETGRLARRSRRGRCRML